MHSMIMFESIKINLSLNLFPQNTKCAYQIKRNFLKSSHKYIIILCSNILSKTKIKTFEAATFLFSTDWCVAGSELMHWNGS
jgi:hypothetical protein